jgi:hypothetical protein
MATELHFSYATNLQVDRLAEGAQLAKLENLWNSGLQHLTLVPAGLLIGCIVHEFRSGEAVSIRWDLGPSDNLEEDGLPAGQRLDPELLDQIDRELLNRDRGPRSQNQNVVTAPTLDRGLIDQIDRELQKKERARRRARGDVSMD